MTGLFIRNAAIVARPAQEKVLSPFRLRMTMVKAANEGGSLPLGTIA
jgi:hypothetical protein